MVIERPGDDIPPLFDITPQRRDEMIEALAQRISKAGMGSPALMFLESQRPLGRIYGSALHVFSPFIGVFVPSIDQYGHLLQDPINLRILIDRLQELEDERGQQQRALRAERKARARERKLKASGRTPASEAVGGSVGDPPSSGTDRPEGTSSSQSS